MFGQTHIFIIENLVPVGYTPRTAGHSHCSALLRWLNSLALASLMTRLMDPAPSKKRTVLREKYSFNFNTF